MARSLSQTLIRQFPHAILHPSPSHLFVARSLSRFLTLRGLSSKSGGGGGHFVEVDLGEAEVSEGEVVAGLSRLEEALHSIVVMRSAPEWLPFVPGSSYWVPPKNKAFSYQVVEVVERIGNPMSEEERMSLTTVRGWPSSSYFIEGLDSDPVDRNQEKNNISPSDEKV